VTGEYQRLLYKMARAYYFDNLTQNQIARRFGLSRIKVSRLLKQARQSKIVNITLSAPSGVMSDLEAQLERKFGLEEVMVIPVENNDDLGGVARELGPAAAECLSRRIHGDEIIGITWGTTMMAVIDALGSKSWPEVQIVQMNGGLGPVGMVEHSTELASRLAQKLNAKLRLLLAPGIVSNKPAAEALKSDKQIAQTLALAARADIAIVGMGIPSADSVLMSDGSILSQHDLEVLRQNGAVGDIGLRYINTLGEPLELEINERIIGLTFEQIKNIPHVIAVAGGARKYEIIRAALRSKIPNILVTDHLTAQKLVNDDNYPNNDRN